jgi:hypothetical protein
LTRSGTTFHRPQSTAWLTLYEGDVSCCIRQMVVTPDTDCFFDPHPNLFLWYLWPIDAYLYSKQRRLVGGAIGGWAHCNVWNAINGTDSNTSNIWKPCLILFHQFHSSHYNEPVLLQLLLPDSYDFQSCEIHRLWPTLFISMYWFPYMNCNSANLWNCCMLRLYFCSVDYSWRAPHRPASELICSSTHQIVSLLQQNRHFLLSLKVLF